MTMHRRSVGNTCGTACGQYADGEYIVRGSAASMVVDCEACKRLSREPLTVHHCGAGGVKPLCAEAIHPSDVIVTDDSRMEVTCAICLAFKRLEHGVRDRQRRTLADAVQRIVTDYERRQPRGDWYTPPARSDAHEQGRGIVDAPGVPQRVAVAVGYDDPTGDDVAADVGPRWRR